METINNKIEELVKYINTNSEGEMPVTSNEIKQFIEYNKYFIAKEVMEERENDDKNYNKLERLSTLEEWIVDKTFNN